MEVSLTKPQIQLCVCVCMCLRLLLLGCPQKPRQRGLPFSKGSIVLSHVQDFFHLP